VINAWAGYVLEIAAPFFLDRVHGRFALPRLVDG
jgi:hypothetical protein